MIIEQVAAFTPLIIAGMLAGIFVGIVIYFIPVIVANYRNSSNVWLVFVINFFLGWSFIGWFGALVLALTGRNEKTKQCPFCYSNINLKAIKCPNCGEWVSKNEK